MIELHPLLIQFGGSLVAITALAGLAVWLRLGGKPVLKDQVDVVKAANEVEDGFRSARISIARSGRAALVQSVDRRIMVVKRHGNKFAGRILTRAAKAREEVDALVVDPGETAFGRVRLSITDAPYWADAINRL